MTPNSKRILAAVMFTDLVGYTRSMHSDEALARKQIERHRQVVEEQHKRYDGKVINYFGDGSLSIFSSSVNAVQCAIEIQRHLKIPVKVPLRIGIDVGDIVIEEGNILGDAVNLASRIESFSVPGAVLISPAVYNQVKNHGQFRFETLGKFHFKNIPKPSAIYALANEGLVVPNPADLQGKGHRDASANEKFPKILATFLGREKEVEEICKLLNDERLITLTGPGGTGKTTLSIKVAWEVVDRFPGGIFWMPLVSVKNVEGVATECMTHLGLQEDPMLSSEEVLIAFFKEKKALLVLDNFEHVIEAAQVFERVLEACNQLSVLVSSRIILQIHAEREYHVPPLTVPRLEESNTLKQLKDIPAIALFVQRAQASRRSFKLTQENAEAVARICVRLDGLPLGIELAAARTKLFNPKSLLERLNKSFDVLKGGGQFPLRHQTIRQTIAWSYDLLEREEQQLFRRISIFVGGSTMTAIESICGETEQLNIDIVEGVEALVDKSLLTVDHSADDVRFFMLETINEFAREELNNSEEQSAVRKAHLNYYLSLTEDAEPHYYSSDADIWVRIISSELSNIRAAINHAIDVKEMALAYRLGKALIPFWSFRGMSANEGVQQLEKLTSVAVSEHLVVERLKLLQSLASFYLYTDVRDKSASIFEECLDYWRQQDDKNQLGLVLNDIGWYHIVVGDFHQGEIYSLEAKVIFERLSNKKRLVASLNSLGMVKMWQSKPLEAIPYFQKTFVLTEELKDQRRNAHSILNTAYCNYLMGKYDMAENQIENALVFFRKSSSRILEATALIWLSYIYYENKDFGKCMELSVRIGEIGQEINILFGRGMAYGCKALAEYGMGNMDSARELIATAENILQHKGEKHFLSVLIMFQAYFEGHMGNLELVRSCCKKLLGSEIENESYTGFIPGLEITASIAVLEGKYESAAQLFFNAQTLRAELGTPIRKSQEGVYQDLMEDLQRNLTEQEYALAQEHRFDDRQLLALATRVIEQNADVS